MKTHLGFDIEKRYNWKTKRKQWSVVYGKGTSKTVGYFSGVKQAKLFINWIVLSDYMLNDTRAGWDAYWKYKDSYA